tara:strand:+ start:36 stop:365 length:330 start_codon:yes stop_codon:yes gene_type:complete
MAKRKRYHPNHWQAIKDTPEHLFPSMSFPMFMDWSVDTWVLPSNVECLVRVRDLTTSKVTEHKYHRRGFAEKKVAKLMEKGAYEFVVVDHNNCTDLYPEEYREQKNRRD